MASIPIGSGLGINVGNVGSTKSAATWSRGGILPIYLWVPDNSRREPGETAAQGYFTVYGLTKRQVFGGDYNGVPHLKLRIQMPAISHGAEACSDGTLLVTMSEAEGETAPPGEFNANYHESVLVIDAEKVRPSVEPEVRDINAADFVRVKCGELGGPPYGPFPAITHVGLRDATQLHDGSILLSRGPIFTRMTLDRLRSKTDLVNAPVQYSTTSGARTGYKITPDPENPEHVWQLGREENLPSALWQFDLTNPPGGSAMDRMGIGQTGGTYVPSEDQYDPNNWGAAMPHFDSLSRVWIARGGVPDLACWTRAQLNQFNGGTPPVNLAPALTVTSSVFASLNLANESIYALEIHEDHFFVATYYYGAVPRPPARMWIFGPEVLNGGAHEPIVEIVGLPSAASQLVFAPGV
jgi:hypothetical protein